MTIEALREKILPVIKQYPMKRILLFGSRASGLNRDDGDQHWGTDNNISDKMRIENPGIPWKAIASMRDVTAHKYQTLRM